MRWGCSHVTDPTSPRSRTQADARACHPLTEGRYRWARAYREGVLVCGRVELTVTADLRLGLTVCERRCLTARFLERVEPGLRAELAELVRRRGAVALRASERMRPVEIVIDDPRLGRQRIVGSVQPPQVRHGDLYRIEFGIRQPAR
jgi:hypothetical protein